MPHPYPVREIARQAGVSEATVDRVLHKRPGVRAGTILQVEQAIADLDRQRTQLRLSGRTFMVDVVMDTPNRFSRLVRESLEAELPGLRPAAIRARFHLREGWPPDDLVATLDSVAAKGSHGIILKAPDTPAVAAAIDRVTAAGVPILTLVTDVPASNRIAYVGMDNRAAGSTAAYLMSQWLRHSDAAVLVMTSRNFFRGEEEREMGFRVAIRAKDACRRVVEISDTDGLDDTSRVLVADELTRSPDIRAVYSIGGGNSGILDAFAAAGRECEVFIGHDLAQENRALLQTGHLTAVLHHDLREDMRHAARSIMMFHGALPGTVRTVRSKIDVITPHNMPGR
ncbi:LacI family DNA-binding transcriptional regulator [Rhodococcoides kyotonense]|uniref:LacI family transcriptional regulator n=1 Tax=Rhodococcoides kyotonense TaxID=398843 RepID=A0A239JV92_9NOCA|nr:LacI family DNA-binding transcriptional regulator [Rhodococcus kyotonensis]SNT08794.1 LacI family transcriptional regulator [Rhodococcus kyotonensis]